MKAKLTTLIAILSCFGAGQASAAEPLHGRINRADLLRLSRPDQGLHDSISIRALGDAHQANAEVRTPAPLDGQVKVEDFRLPELKQQQAQPDFAREQTRLLRSMNVPDPLQEEQFLLRSRLPGNCGDCLRRRNMRTWVNLQFFVPATQAQLIAPNSSANLFPPATSEMPRYVFPSPVPPPQPVEMEEVAWNNWYKQVAAAIYQKWTHKPKEAGRAVVRISVTNRRHISATILGAPNVSPVFEHSLHQAIAALDGTTVLTFPANSRRSNASFEADFVTGPTNSPGVDTSRVADKEIYRKR